MFDPETQQVVPKVLHVGMQDGAEALFLNMLVDPSDGASRAAFVNAMWSFLLAAAPARVVQDAGQEAEITDPFGCLQCAHKDCGRYVDGTRYLCHAMRDDACARDTASSVNGGERDLEWRCFHCGETFDNRESAALHFGTSEIQAPACTIDIAEYRAMEARMRDYNNEDTELHREIARLQGKHATELRREEEKGYARGLADGADARQVGGDGRDHIALAKAMLVLVDEYHERPSSDTRTALRAALTDEFGKLFARVALSADRGEDTTFLDAMIENGWDVLRYPKGWRVACINGRSPSKEFHTAAREALRAAIAAKSSKQL